MTRDRCGLLWSGFVYGASLGEGTQRVLDLANSSLAAIAKVDPAGYPGSRVAQALDASGWTLDDRDESTRACVLGLCVGLFRQDAREACDLAMAWCRPVSHNHGLDFAAWCATAVVLAAQGREREEIVTRGCRWLFGSELPLIVKDLKKGLRASSYDESVEAIRQFYARYLEGGRLDHALPNFAVCAAAMMDTGESAGLPELVARAGLDDSLNAAILGAIEAMALSGDAQAERQAVQADRIGEIGLNDDVENLVEKHIGLL